MDRKYCFKFQDKQLVGNLNVTSNLQCLVFWNKFQIFIIDKQELEIRRDQPNWRLVFYYTDFEIQQLILATHLLCLDNVGNLLTYSLNLEHTVTAEKRPKHSFQKLEHSILCMQFFDNLLFSIKLEANKLFLRVHKITTDNLSVKAILQSNNKIEKNLLQLGSAIKRQNCIMTCYKVGETEFDSIKQTFNRKKSLKCEQFIIVVSFDKKSLYALLVDLELNSDVLVLVKLLTSPSEINSIVVVKDYYLNLLISLSSGTLIKQPLNNNFNTYNIRHLNSAIHRFTVLNDKIIYTDGITMWVSTNPFLEPDAKLRQMFIMNVNDFIQIDSSGEIICTTFSKLVYSCNINDETSYLVPTAASEYCSAEHLINNMNYMYKITEELEKNNEIIKNIKKEENYITILALSNRQDIVNEIIQCSVSVYEKYEYILKEGLVLYLTNNMKDYFQRDSFYFLIKISLTKQQYYGDVLANIFTDSKIHLTILSDQKTIKTISVILTDQLQVFNIVVPVKMTDKLTDITCDTKIVKKIPKVLNCKDHIWTTVYCKQVTLTPEHFIKTNTSDNVCLLKDCVDPIEKLLFKTIKKHYGHLFRFTKSSDFLTWSFYIKLPDTYKEILLNEAFFKEHLNSITAKFLFQGLSSEEFLNSRKNISFLVFNEKLTMEIINDAYCLNTKKIKVSCMNPVLALGIRNFFSKLMYKNIQGYQQEQIFINLRIISAVEKTEKLIKNCMDKRFPFEEFFKIYEQFQISLCETLL